MFSYIFYISIIFLNSFCSCRYHSRFHHISINENEKFPHHLLSFNLPNSIKSYQLVSTNSQLHKYFSIENQTHLYAIQSLDREYLCSEQFCSCITQCSIQLKILSQPQHQIIFVNITINDLNDNLHYFRFNEIQIRIPENTNIQHRQCYRIPTVEDKDLPETNQFIYQLIGNGSEKFEIDHSIGNDLCLTIKNSPLDREEQDRYDNLWIIATDKLKRQAKMKIIIQVLDINDNSPKFLTNLTKIYVNETFIGTKKIFFFFLKNFFSSFFLGELTCIQAYDPDEGNNGRVIYSFDHFDDKLKEFLYLNNETGCLSVIQPLLLTSFDLIPLLQLNNHLLLTIRAQDSGSRMSSTLPVYHPLELIIQDINDHKPNIQVRQIISSIDIIQNNSQINIMENTMGLLAMVTVEDIDQGIYGHVQLTLIVQTSIKKHQQAFQLKPTSMKHYKVIRTL
jgi:protocadherin Fat 1/2/3